MPFIKTLFVRAKFTKSTANTSTFNTTEAIFKKVLRVLDKKGINPYALMNW